MNNKISFAAGIVFVLLFIRAWNTGSWFWGLLTAVIFTAAAMADGFLSKS